MILNELLEPNAKKVVFTFGRFNPPTRGHARLMDVVKNAASGADHYVFTGRTNDPKKNPLEYKDKITFLRAMFPHMNIMDDPKIRTPWEALEELGKQYDEVVMVVGSDRKQDFETQMRPYLKDFGIEKFSIVSSGERDADASDVSGVSASKARALAKAGDFKSFSGTIDGGEKLKKQLYTKVRQGMGIMEMANKPKMPKKPEIKSRDPNWRDMEAIRKSGAAGSHKDKKALDKRGYQKHKGKSFDMDEAEEKGKPIVYVDMDGVLANFFAEYANLAGVKSGNYKDIPPAKTDPTLNKMIGTDFFNRLPKFPTTDKLIQMVTKQFGSYKILSSPLRGDHENSKQQKIKWIKRELAIQPKEIIVVGRKDSYAVQADGTPNILIDDRGKNITDWIARGGYGIKYQADEDPLSKVKDGLEQYKGEGGESSSSGAASGMPSIAQAYRKGLGKESVQEHGGRVVKGINTTHDVGVDAIKKQSAKLGFKVTNDGVPPIMAPKNLRRIKRMQEALIKINGSNKNLTLQQQIDLQEIKKGIKQLVKEAKKKRSNPSEVPYQNQGGEMSLLTHPGTEMWQKMKAKSKPGTDDWFKTWRTLSYLTKGRKNHYMLPVKEELEKLLIKHGIIKEDPQAVQDLAQKVAELPADVSPRIIDKINKALRLARGGDSSQYKKVARAVAKVKDPDLQTHYEAVAKAMISNGLTTAEMSGIIREIKNNTCVDLKQLKQPFNTLDKILKFYDASTETQKYYRDLLMYQPGQRIGPGEILLATHSKTLIKGQKGDLTVMNMEGEPAGEIEVKGGKDAGRFTDDDLEISAAYKTKVDQWAQKYAVIPGFPYTQKSGTGYGPLAKWLTSNQEKADEVLTDLKSILDSLFPRSTRNDNIIQSLKNGQAKAAAEYHALANIEEYFSVKKGGMGILFINAKANPPKTSYADTLEELLAASNIREYGSYPVSTNKTAPFPKISVIPKA